MTALTIGRFEEPLGKWNEKCLYYSGEVPSGPGAKGKRQLLKVLQQFQNNLITLNGTRLVPTTQSTKGQLWTLPSNFTNTSKNLRLVSGESKSLTSYNKVAPLWPSRSYLRPPTLQLHTRNRHYLPWSDWQVSGGFSPAPVDNYSWRAQWPLLKPHLNDLNDHKTPKIPLIFLKTISPTENI